MLQEYDDAPNGSGWPVALGYGFWADHFGGDPHVIGRHLTISLFAIEGIGRLRSGVSRPMRKQNCRASGTLSFLSSFPVNLQHLRYVEQIYM
jgi:hypothetical protein